MANVRVDLLAMEPARPSGPLAPTGRATTNDRGEFRIDGLQSGRYYLCATSFRSGSSLPSPAYTPTCYPKAAKVADAAAITVGRVERRDVSMTMLPPTPLATISGKVIDANNQPVTKGIVSLNSRANFPPFAAVPIQSNGTFTIPGVIAGEYLLRTAPPIPPTPLYRPDVSVAEVTVTGGSDLKEVVMAPVRAVKISGRLTIPPAFARSIQTKFIRIGMVAAAASPLVVVPPPATVVNPDLTFTLTTPALPMLIEVLGGGALMEKAVRIGSRDFITTPFDFHPGHDVAGIEIEMTESPVLMATVTEAGGAAPRDRFVFIVFPQERDKWMLPQAFGRWFAFLSALNGDTTFAIRTLWPGRYYAVALDHVDNNWRDSDVLDRLKSRAAAFDLGDGEHKALHVQLSKWP